MHVCVALFSLSFFCPTCTAVINKFVCKDKFKMICKEIQSPNQINSFAIPSAKDQRRFKTEHKFECSISYLPAPNLETIQISEFEVLVGQQKCGAKFN